MIRSHRRSCLPRDRPRNGHRKRRHRPCCLFFCYQWEGGSCCCSSCPRSAMRHCLCRAWCWLRRSLRRRCSEERRARRENEGPVGEGEAKATQFGRSARSLWCAIGATVVPWYLGARDQGRKCLRGAPPADSCDSSLLLLRQNRVLHIHPARNPLHTCTPRSAHRPSLVEEPNGMERYGAMFTCHGSTGTSWWRGGCGRPSHRACCRGAILHHFRPENVPLWPSRCCYGRRVP